jgi:hypothetical protein
MSSQRCSAEEDPVDEKIWYVEVDGNNCGLFPGAFKKEAVALGREHFGNIHDLVMACPIN